MCGFCGCIDHLTLTKMKMAESFTLLSKTRLSSICLTCSTIRHVAFSREPTTQNFANLPFVFLKPPAYFVSFHFNVFYFIKSKHYKVLSSTRAGLVGKKHLSINVFCFIKYCKDWSGQLLQEPKNSCLGANSIYEYDCDFYLGR